MERRPHSLEKARAERNADQDLADDDGLFDRPEDDTDQTAEHEHDHEAQQQGEEMMFCGILGG